MVMARIGVTEGARMRRMDPGCAPAMHRTGYDRSGNPGQRRDPRPEESNKQIDGEQSTHHDDQSTVSDSGRNTRQKTCHKQNQKCKAQLHGSRAPKMDGSDFIHQSWLNTAKVVRADCECDRDQKQLEEQDLTVRGLPQSREVPEMYPRCNDTTDGDYGSRKQRQRRKRVHERCDG